LKSSLALNGDDPDVVRALQILSPGALSPPADPLGIRERR
jgi:hypothetical protein